MKIGFEAKRFFKNFTGLGNYSRFIVDALSQYAPSNDYFLFTPRFSDHPEVTRITHRNNVKVITPSLTFRSLRLTSVWRSWGVSLHPTVKDLDVFHGLSHELPLGLPKKIKKVVTVHDLIFYRYPKLYHPIDIKIYKTKLKFACKSADKIIAISNQTADDLVHYVKVDPSKIQVVYQGCHPIFKHKVSHEDVIRVTEKYSLPKEYILNVGTIEERKNVLLLIKALALLPPALRWPVVIMGRATDYLDEIKRWASKLKVLNLITFLHNIPFTDFPAIYRGAKVFVYPSIFEGFGIPLIEAIECGVPVITSQGSCFSEAAGPDSIYVDALKEEELAEALKKVLNSESLRDEMISKSRLYIKKFEPQIIAHDLQSIYNL